MNSYMARNVGSTGVFAEAAGGGGGGTRADVVDEFDSSREWLKPLIGLPTTCRPLGVDFDTEFGGSPGPV